MLIGKFLMQKLLVIALNSYHMQWERRVCMTEMDLINMKMSDRTIRNFVTYCLELILGFGFGLC